MRSNLLRAEASDGSIGAIRRSGRTAGKRVAAPEGISLACPVCGRTHGASIAQGGAAGSGQGGGEASGQGGGAAGSGLNPGSYPTVPVTSALIPTLAPTPTYERLNNSQAQGTAWNVTYYFLPNVPFNLESGPKDNFQPFSTAERNATLAAFTLISELTNLTFTAVSSYNAAQVVFGHEDMPGSTAGYANYFYNYTSPNHPSNEFFAEVWLDNDASLYSSMATSTIGYEILLHELGHAMGLKHPFDDTPTLTATLDNTLITVMSYTDPAGHASKRNGTYGLLDILAIQQLYGANYSTRAGDTVYFNTGGSTTLYSGWTTSTYEILTVWDGGGNDTFNLANQVARQIINLNEGQFSDLGASTTWNVAIAIGVTIENATGGSGNDDIIGNAVANILIGNGGNDTIKGGAGNDTITGNNGEDDLRGEDGNDTITPGAGNDAIVGGAGLDKAIISANRSDYTVSWTGTNWTIAGSEGTDTFVSVEHLVFNDGTYAIGTAATGVLNGDSTSDFFWQNSNGTAAVWTLNGFTVTQAAVAGSNPGPTWEAKGTGDINGDGIADLLWQNTSGAVAVWFVNGATVQSTSFIGSNPGPGWSMAGAGDFNGDGKEDLLWRNTSGQAAVWMLDGANVVSTSLLGGIVDNSWQIRGVGDFDGDGRSDVIWQDASGLAALWLLDGAAIKSSGLVGGPVDPSWTLIGTGDFNGEGRADILWQNENGQAAIWLMNGFSVSSAGIVGNNLDPTWEAIGSGDFNGDGYFDIAWRNTASSATAIWMMNGLNPTSTALVSGPSAGPDWRLVIST